MEQSSFWTETNYLDDEILIKTLFYIVLFILIIGTLA